MMCSKSRSYPTADMAAPTVGSTSPSVSLAARSATPMASASSGLMPLPAAFQGADLRVGAEPAAGRVHLGEVAFEHLAGFGQRARVGHYQLDQRAEGPPAR